MSAGLVYDLSGLKKLEARVRRLSRSNKPELLDIVGALVESQTRRRIQSEKESPTGKTWPAWSAKYAAKRPSGRTLLMNEDHLLDTITYLRVDQDSIEVGSNMIYAATHQFGDDDRNIPERAFLGISEANETELIHNIDNYLDGFIRR
ncbi:MAG: phage virion morphogenesis protein [Smithella sp.]